MNPVLIIIMIDRRYPIIFADLIDEHPPQVPMFTLVMLAVRCQFPYSPSIGKESMTRWTTCHCRSHCTTFNPRTGRYEGPGVSLPVSTARRHSQEDARIETFDNLTENVASHAFDDFTIPTRPTPSPHTHSTTPTIASHGFPPHSDNPSYVELLTLESEIGDRISWAPADKRLVFSEEPGALQEFVRPKYSEVHLSNHGPHALDPANHANTAYVENERRLCEILVHIRELDPMDDSRERLEDKVMEGFRAMQIHKEQEWNRQRLGSIARYRGHAVVDSGEPFSCPLLALDIT